jgi:quinohemoprotein ethanol dehydrogenase
LTGRPERIDLKTGRPVEMPDSHFASADRVIWPGPLGDHNWQSMSFSPVTGLAYIPTMQLAVRDSKRPGKEEIVYGGVVEAPLKVDPLDGTGRLLAWDPVAQKARWSVPRNEMWNGGTLVTSGGLVFQGTADGLFSAYDAASGQRLWSMNAGLGIVSSPITFSRGGKQYVAILVGYGGNTFGSAFINIGWKFGAQPRRLLAFALDATAKLPQTAPRDPILRPVDDPSYKIDKTILPEGRTLYTWNCSLCHGIDLASSGEPAPDLRESTAALDRSKLWTIVHDGALRGVGMPRFEKLTAAQVDKIYAFIRAGARDALTQNRTPETATSGTHPR